MEVVTPSSLPFYSSPLQPLRHASRLHSVFTLSPFLLENFSEKSLPNLVPNYPKLLMNMNNHLLWMILPIPERTALRKHYLPSFPFSNS
jgi:hypothetical protein